MIKYASERIADGETLGLLINKDYKEKELPDLFTHWLSNELLWNTVFTSITPTSIQSITDTSLVSRDAWDDTQLIRDITTVTGTTETVEPFYKVANAFVALQGRYLRLDEGLVDQPLLGAIQAASKPVNSEEDLRVAWDRLCQVVKTLTGKPLRDRTVYGPILALKEHFYKETT